MNDLIKQLVESQISNYLEESYEDDLMESIMDEVSEETWEAIEEAILSELSPATLSSYRVKAKAQAEKGWDTMKAQEKKANSASRRSDKQHKGSPERDRLNKASDKAWSKAREAEKIHDKRGDGYNLAGRKLGK